jgi:hypothetical protein
MENITVAGLFRQNTTLNWKYIDKNAGGWDGFYTQLQLCFNFPLVHSTSNSLQYFYVIQALIA